MTEIASTSRVFALLGDPVRHSFSPEIQNAAMRAAGLDGVYVAVPTREAELAGMIRGLARGGGGGNITLPHKERAASLLDLPNSTVRRTGACNTFWADERGRVVGDNTDVEGFRRALAHFLSKSPRDARVLMLGAGGAARAALVSLLEDGVGEVRIFNRSVERARAVSRRIGGERVRVVPLISELHGEDFDLVVNATRLGLSPDDPLPLELEVLTRAGAIFDMVYGETTTPFVQAAEARGIRATDGLEMLIRQGAAAFECWWGREAPLDAMREAFGRRRAARETLGHRHGAHGGARGGGPEG
ncbi:MAG: shikimate dehydrogenase [Longimicrobiales bacterium]|nr:shikimate dehydrogenase [Longimicrobiales bacterium]